jgi:hypothetical protein
MRVARDNTEMRCSTLAPKEGLLQLPNEKEMPGGAGGIVGGS